MTMTLGQMADELLAIIEGDRPRLNKTEMREYVRDLLATNAAHLTQPAQACEHDWAVGYGVPAYCNHCGVERDPKPAQWVDVIPEGCIVVPRSLVERWANVDAFNAPVGAAMELRVIAGEMLMHAAALQEKGNG